MKNLIIRKADWNDMAKLLKFEQGVIEAERPFDSTLKRTDTRYYDIEEMIRASYIELIVAQVNDELIGCGYVRIENSKPYLQHVQHGYLGFMYVKPEHRGKGVNGKIIDALRRWALAQGITELRLEVYYLNEPAIKAYEKIGFTRHMIEMRQAI